MIKGYRKVKYSFKMYIERAKIELRLPMYCIRIEAIEKTPSSENV